jgi:hypothetical protein
MNLNLTRWTRNKYTFDLVENRIYFFKINSSFYVTVVLDRQKVVVKDVMTGIQKGRVQETSTDVMKRKKT